MLRYATALVVMTNCLFVGCERHQEADEGPPIQQTQYDAIMVVLLDMSGSYLETIRTKAFPFFSAAADMFFRERLGEGDDKIVIAQISGVSKALLFDGSPRALRNQFAGAAAFKAFLSSKSSPAGSRVHDGIADALEYILDYPGVREGKTRTSLFCFTDMEDTFPDSEKSKARLVKLFSDYSKTKGCVGMYWVDQRFVPEWRRNFRDSGMKHFVVESDIAVQPKLPSFEQ